jgi:putative ABC transport system permease protein
MFKNYLLTAIRNLFRYKLYSAINIGGLAVGLAACVLIFLYIRDELNFDSFLPDTDNVYLLEASVNTPGRDPFSFLFTQSVIKPFMEQEFPEIEEMTRSSLLNINIRQEGDIFAENLLVVDDNFFDVLQFPLLSGDIKRVLSDSSSIAISQKMAEKYFAGSDPMGETISGVINEEIRDFRVAAVLQDLPLNSNLQFDFLAHLEESYFPPNLFGPSIFENWISFSFTQYIKFADGADIENINRRLLAMLDRIVPESVTAAIQLKPSEYLTYDFIPLNKIHLNADAAPIGNVPPVDIKTISALGVIAILILFIASINFMNLATARSSLRAREVALRKTLGATRSQLIFQFLGEAFLLTMIALALAALLVEIALPFYNQLITKNIATGYLSQPVFLAVLSGLALVVGIGAGMYPAFHLSSFRPARVLKSNRSSAHGSTRLRSLLVIVQFSISIALITATVVVIQQTRYAQSMESGYNPENVLIVRGMNRVGNAVLYPFMEQVGRHPDVINVAHSTMVPSDGQLISTSVTVQGQSEAQMVGYIPVGFNFFETFEVEPVAGRLYSEAFGTDSSAGIGETAQRPEGAAIINERAVRYLGFADAQGAIGKSFIAGINFKTRYSIIGVVPDINFGSLRDELRPEMYSLNENGGSVSIRYRGDDEQGFLDYVDQTWTSLEPNQPVVRQILQDNIDALYLGDKNLSVMMAVFSILAVLVSVLGLFGLSAFTAELRTKEVGIRKSLGASIPDVVRLLVWQFSKPVFIANLLAWPVAWYFMNDWLNGFSYRIDLSPMVFLLSGIAALLVAWATVAAHAWRVAQSNPIHALRYE